jgi:hypothetical protein
MSPRTSRVSNDTVEMAFYLVFNEAGSVRLTRTEGKLDRGEKSMGLMLKVPRSLWKTPQLRATVEIADPGVPQATIDVQAASAALREVTGLDIDVRVVVPGDRP